MTKRVIKEKKSNVKRVTVQPKVEVERIIENDRLIIRYSNGDQEFRAM